MQPSVYLFGWRVDEPMTTATDILITIVAWCCAWRLGKCLGNTAFSRWVVAYFLIFGFSTLLGGLLGHAFLYTGNFSKMKLMGWWPGVIATACLARASVELARLIIGNLFLRLLEGAIWLILGITTVGIFYSPDFWWVKLSGLCQVVGIVLPVVIYVYLKKRSEDSRFFLLAIAVTTLASIVFSQKISLHLWFNHADLSHVLLAVAAIFYFRGARYFLLNEKINATSIP